MYHKLLGIAGLCALLVCSSVDAADIQAGQEAAKPQIEKKADSIPNHLKAQLVNKAYNIKQEQHSANYKETTMSIGKKDAAQIKKTLEKGQKVPRIEQRVLYRGVLLPRDYKSIGIFGDNEVTMGQAAAYIRKINPAVRLDCSVEELVELYWKEAALEGVRGDLALCQAIVETGFFRYGGDVSHHQNNFCGLGTVGKGVRGAGFSTPQIGVRAHIQHLLAYSKKARPTTKIVDPRYDLAHNIRLERGLVSKWSGLNGTWAMGNEYCEKIMTNYVNMLEIKGVTPTFNTKLKSNGERKSMKERIKSMRNK